jgi:hypothetical protein
MNWSTISVNTSSLSRITKYTNVRLLFTYKSGVDHQKKNKSFTVRFIGEKIFPSEKLQKDFTFKREQLFRLKYKDTNVSIPIELSRLEAFGYQTGKF